MRKGHSDPERPASSIYFQHAQHGAFKRNPFVDDSTLASMDVHAESTCSRGLSPYAARCSPWTSRENSTAVQLIFTFTVRKFDFLTASATHLPWCVTRRSCSVRDGYRGQCCGCRVYVREGNDNLRPRRAFQRIEIGTWGEYQKLY